MSIESLAHVCIKTADLEKTAAFYCGTLGMKKTFSFKRGEDVIGFYLKASNTTFIEVFLAAEIPPTSTRHSVSHFCLQTNALEDLRQRLLESGYSPREIKMGADDSLQFWIADPNGIEVEFQQYSDRSAQLTSQDVEVDW